MGKIAGKKIDTYLINITYATLWREKLQIRTIQHGKHIAFSHKRE